jgi:hypothetical protein
MKYTVEWEELVYDGFDNLEGINAGEVFEVEADSISTAMDLAQSQADHLVDEKRPDKSHGDFVARVLSLTEVGGNGQPIIIATPMTIE